MDETQIPGFFTIHDREGDLVYIKADQVRFFEQLHDEKCKSCINVAGSTRWALEEIADVAAKIAAVLSAAK